MAFVKGDEFASEKIVSGCEVSGDCEIKLSFVRSEFIDAPLLGLLIVAIFEDFEPYVSASGFRVRQIDNARSLVAWVDDEGIAGSHSHLVMPLDGHFRTRLDGALLRSGLVGSGRPSTGHIGRAQTACSIQSIDRVIVFGAWVSSHTFSFLVSSTIDGDRTEIRVSVNRRNKYTKYRKGKK